MEGCSVRTHLFCLSHGGRRRKEEKKDYTDRCPEIEEIGGRSVHREDQEMGEALSDRIGLKDRKRDQELEELDGISGIRGGRWWMQGRYHDHPRLDLSRIRCMCSESTCQRYGAGDADAERPRCFADGMLEIFGRSRATQQLNPSEPRTSVGGEECIRCKAERDVGQARGWKGSRDEVSFTSSSSSLTEFRCHKTGQPRESLQQSRELMRISTPRSEV